MADVVLDRVKPEGVDDRPGKIIAMIATQKAYWPLDKVYLVTEKQASSAVLHHQHKYQ